MGKQQLTCSCDGGRQDRTWIALDNAAGHIQEHFSDGDYTLKGLCHHMGGRGQDGEFTLPATSSIDYIRDGGCPTNYEGKNRHEPDHVTTEVECRENQERAEGDLGRCTSGWTQWKGTHALRLHLRTGTFGCESPAQMEARPRALHPLSMRRRCGSSVSGFVAGHDGRRRRR